MLNAGVSEGEDVGSDPAPDVGRGYPSGGTRIGPAWQVAWRGLAGGEWVSMRAAAVEFSSGICSPAALGSVMSQATRAGALEARREGGQLLVRRRPVVQGEIVPAVVAEPDQAFANVAQLADELNALPAPGPGSARPHIDPPRARRRTT